LHSLWIVACVAGRWGGVLRQRLVTQRGYVCVLHDAHGRAGAEHDQSCSALLSKEQAAERYLAIVEPYNVALEALEQAVNGPQSVDALRTQAASVAAANDTHVQELKAAAWPADVQPAVDEPVAESEQAQTYWLQASEAPTREAAIAAAVSAGEHDGGAAAQAIRSLLGLGDYDEVDYTASGNG
jgi:hypothetical protein